MPMDIHVAIYNSGYCRQLIGDLLVAKSLAEPTHYLALVSGAADLTRPAARSPIFHWLVLEEIPDP
jgi:hypothetical protein